MLSLLLFACTSLTGSTTAIPAARVAAEETHRGIPWFGGTLEEALARAKAEKRVVYLDLWTTSCAWCRKLDRDTYGDDTVVSALKDLICLKVDAESAVGRPLAQRFGASLYPTLVVLDADGQMREKLSGYRSPSRFKLDLARILAKPSVADLRAAVDAQKSSVERRWALASRLLEANDPRGAEAEIAAIRLLDPDGKSLAMHFVALQDLTDRVDGLWRQGRAAETPTALKEFIAKETYPEVQFRAWNLLGQIYGGLLQQARDPAAAQRYSIEARQAQVTAWRTAPDSEALEFGLQVLRELEANQDKLGADDKGFALDVATRIEKLGGADAEALDLVAGAYFMNGHKDDALRLLRRAIELEPRNADLEKRLKAFGG